MLIKKHNNFPFLSLHLAVRNVLQCRLRLKRYGTCAETRFRLSTKRTSPFKSAVASVQWTTGRRAVHISLQVLYCSCEPVFCSHVTLTGYPFHSLVSPSLRQPVSPCAITFQLDCTVCYRLPGCMKCTAVRDPTL
jgi:hypothetical protein